MEFTAIEKIKVRLILIDSEFRTRKKNLSIENTLYFSRQKKK